MKNWYPLVSDYKVHIFWEGHKFFAKSPPFFDWYFAPVSNKTAVKIIVKPSYFSGRNSLKSRLRMATLKNSNY